MKLKCLTVAGFRGFNGEERIHFHDKLTVIAAPNSHGKTSISEALEFLIYGTTSKVENADSKEEYKDSYRNRHFPAENPTYIEAVFVQEANIDQTLRVELNAEGTIKRFLDGKPVEAWPFHGALPTAARPFVLQHALKYLLLVPPSDRFQGFARLLGLNELDTAFQAILSLCTKPMASLSAEGQRILSELESIEGRTKVVAELKKVVAKLRKGGDGLGDAYSLIERRADGLLGTKVKPEERLANLTEARAAAAAKVYSGDVAIQAFTPAEAKQLDSDHTTLSTGVDVAFLEDYGRLCVQGATARLQKEASLLNLGVELMQDSPDSCPLCTQALSDELRYSINQRHASAKTEIEKGAAREQSRPRVNRRLAELDTALEKYEELSERRISNLLASMQPENAPKVCELLGGANATAAEMVRVSAQAAHEAIKPLRAAAASVREAALTCQSGVRENSTDLPEAEALGRALQAYIGAANEFVRQTADLERSLLEPAATLRQAVDALAGTAEMSLLIELLEKRSTIRRALRVRDVLEGLKELRKHAEQTLAETMEASMSTDLTTAVMKWYEKIRTDGDPDVHFSGFAMERTKGGDFKSRRLAVKASSYGVELASAVSSLSESKLNALGLCVSIASAIRSPGPWGFLIIDDPIQSWDDEHETRFIEVVRELVQTEKKQVVVLSHKGTWVKQLCQGCRTLNGFHLEITGYTKAGPHIAAIDWSPIDYRLREADGITNDNNATSLRLQQAEEEVRLAACQMASQVAKDKLNRTTSAHNMNSKDVRAILVEAGCAPDLVDRISAMFVTADDAHHAPKNYEPNRQRIRRAVAAIREVLRESRAAPPSLGAAS